MSAKVPRQAVRSSRKIMLVDDHPLMREGIGQCISRQDDLELCGQAESAAEALRVVERLKPDLVLVDLFARPQWPGIDQGSQGPLPGFTCPGPLHAR